MLGLYLPTAKAGGFPPQTPFPVTDEDPSRSGTGSVAGTIGIGHLQSTDQTTGETMATAQITIDTDQANRLAALRTENRNESVRLVDAAKEATERRRPGMLARSEELAGVADLLDALLAQVPTEVMDPPPPPAWVADGIALVPGQAWPHHLDEATGTWMHPDNGEEYADEITASPSTTEELVEAGAVRLPAILQALGEQAEATEAAARAQEAAASEADQADDEDEDEIDDLDPHGLADVPIEELPLPGFASDED